MAPQADGRTLREHLEAVAEATGTVPARLADHGEMPQTYAHVWGWFRDLSRRRSAGWASNPISWVELRAWSELTGIQPDRVELALLTDLDDFYLAAQATARAESARNGKH